MHSKITRTNLIALIIALGILASSACNPEVRMSPTSPAIQPSPVAEDCQDATEPTEQDLKYALNFTKNVFQPGEWERSYTVEPTRASVTWLSSEGGLAYLEYLLFNCGYTQTDVDEYFSDQTLIEVILQNYGNPQQTAVCNDGKDIKLHEFTAQMYDQNYLLRLWIKQVNSTRLMYLLMAFPENLDWSLEKYSQSVFPSLKSC